MKHDPIVLYLRRRRLLDALGFALTYAALFAVFATVASLMLDDVEAAWDFTFGLAGTAVTLFAVGVCRGRLP